MAGDYSGRRSMLTAGLFLAAFVTAVAFQVGHSGAATQVDAGLIGDPACNATNFRGTNTGAGPYYQEFVAGSPGLIAVDLCLENPGADHDVHVAVRHGSATEPGEYVTSTTTTVTAGTFGYVRFSFLESPFTPVGQRYVIEFGDSQVHWRSLCGAVDDDCNSVDPDLYPAGVSNRADLADFGFRTAPVTPAGMPSGTPDQALRDDPPCNATEFRGFGSSAGPLYQEFVPTASGLDAVDLCLQTFNPNTPVTVNIHSGTAAAPGQVIGSASTMVAVPGFQWVHIDLAGALPTTPGRTFVLELPVSTGFQWRSTCPGTGALCGPTGDPDLYPAGSAPDGRDYVFRTFGGVPEMRRLGLLSRD